MNPNQKRAVMLAKRQLSQFVCDAVNLEGINFTLSEVQELLEGTVIEGHDAQDHRITLNQADAWQKLLYSIEQDAFVVSPQVACELHAIAGKEEALEWGKFRSSRVTIAGTNYLPPNHQELRNLFKIMVDEADEFPDIIDRAIHLFLSMARNQFFYDVNKRMGRFMMNGLLLSNGYPVINLPARRQAQFNQLMLDFYQSNDQQPMNRFLRSCLEKQP